MRVAVAGSGAMARYIAEEFPKHGHDVVILARSEKEFFRGRPNITQIITDYSVASLTAAVNDCDILISMILSYASDFIDVHVNLIKACQASPRCKRFIPSEYGGNLEEYPDLPLFYYQSREPIRRILREQTELEWTLVSVGWLIDYVVPQNNRYLADIGEAFPINLTSKTIIIPGTGKDVFDVTAARDLAKALALLINAPSWEQYTYISGDQTCYNDLARLVKHRYPEMSDIQYSGLGKILDTIQSSTDEDEVLLSHYKLFVPLGAGSFDPEKVEAHRRKYFSGLAFRTPEQLIEEVDRDPNAVADGGHRKVVQVLLDWGADVNAQGGPYGNALQAASIKGHEKLVQMLLDRGIDIDAQSGGFGNALQAASIKDHEKVVQMLVSRGAGLDIRDSTYGHTPLSLAAEKGHNAIVKILLSTGKVCVNAKDNCGRTPLFVAAQYGRDTVAKAILIDDFVDPDQKDHYGSTPLSVAVRHGHIEVVKVLLATGIVSCDFHDCFGRSVFWWAKRSGNADIEKMWADYSKRRGLPRCGDESADVRSIHHEENRRENGEAK